VSWSFAIFARAVFVVFRHNLLLGNLNSFKLLNTLFHCFSLFWPLAIIAVQLAAIAILLLLLCRRVFDILPFATAILRPKQHKDGATN